MCSYFELKWTRWSSRGNGRPPSWCSDPLSILVEHYQKQPRYLKFTSRMSCPSENVPGQRWSLRADPHHQPIIDNPLQSNSIQSNWIRFNPTQSNLAQLMGGVKLGQIILCRLLLISQFTPPPQIFRVSLLFSPSLSFSLIFTNGDWQQLMNCT